MLANATGASLEETTEKEQLSGGKFMLNFMTCMLGMKKFGLNTEKRMLKAGSARRKD